MWLNLFNAFILNSLPHAHTLTLCFRSLSPPPFVVSMKSRAISFSIYKFSISPFCYAKTQIYFIFLRSQCLFLFSFFSVAKRKNYVYMRLTPNIGLRLVSIHTHARTRTACIILYSFVVSLKVLNTLRARVYMIQYFSNWLCESFDYTPGEALCFAFGNLAVFVVRCFPAIRGFISFSAVCVLVLFEFNCKCVIRSFFARFLRYKDSDSTSEPNPKSNEEINVASAVRDAFFFL